MKKSGHKRPDFLCKHVVKSHYGRNQTIKIIKKGEDYTHVEVHLHLGDFQTFGLAERCRLISGTRLYHETPKPT